MILVPTVDSNDAQIALVFVFLSSSPLLIVQALGIVLVEGAVATYVPVVIPWFDARETVLRELWKNIRIALTVSAARSPSIPIDIVALTDYSGTEP